MPLARKRLDSTSISRGSTLHLGQRQGGCINGLGGESQSFSRAVHLTSSTENDSTTTNGVKFRSELDCRVSLAWTRIFTTRPPLHDSACRTEFREPKSWGGYGTKGDRGLLWNTSLSTQLRTFTQWIKDALTRPQWRLRTVELCPLDQLNQSSRGCVATPTQLMIVIATRS